MMKVNAVLFVSVLVISVSCDKVEDLLTFPIRHETTFTIESASPLNVPLPIPLPDVTTNSSQTFENNNTRADLVKDIRLEDLRLTIDSPAGKNFNFLKSVYVYISTSSSPEIQLAYVENVPMNVTQVDLMPTGERLDSYVKASSYKLRTSVVTREALTQSVDIRVNLEFKVTAKPL